MLLFAFLLLLFAQKGGIYLTQVARREPLHLGLFRVFSGWISAAAPLAPRVTGCRLEVTGVLVAMGRSDGAWPPKGLGFGP